MADRWHLENAYCRASDTEREQILSLLDWGKHSEVIELAIRIIERRQEMPQQQGPEPVFGRVIDVDGAARFIAMHSDSKYTMAAIVQKFETYREPCRKVASKLHPNVGTGSEEEYKLLGQAKNLLDRHHKLKGAAA